MVSKNFSVGLSVCLSVTDFELNHLRTGKIGVTTKSTKCSLFQTKRELLVDRKDLRAVTLVGLTRENPVPDPIAVLNLDNQLLIWPIVFFKIVVPKSEIMFFSAKQFHAFENSGLLYFLRNLYRSYDMRLNRAPFKPVLFFSNTEVVSTIIFCFLFLTFSYCGDC